MLIFLIGFTAVHSDGGFLVFGTRVPLRLLLQLKAFLFSLKLIPLLPRISTWVRGCRNPESVVTEKS